MADRADITPSTNDVRTPQPVRARASIPEAGMSISPTQSRPNLHSVLTLANQQNLNELRNIFADVNENLDQETLETLAADTSQEKPGFPFFIFSLAIIKDILDAITGGAISFVFSLIFGCIIFLWLLGKVGFGQKALIRWAARTGSVVALVESIPVLGALPMSSIFVLLAHYRETKAVQLLFWALEKARGQHLLDIKKDRADLVHAIEKTV